MTKAIQVAATVAAFILVGVAIYVGVTSSWIAGGLLFVLAGGVEFIAYSIRTDEERGRDS